MSVPPGGMGCYVTARRRHKTGRIMAAWMAGVGEGVLVTRDENPLPVAHHVLWGQVWTAERIIPPVRERGGHVWQIDNGWVGSARGGTDGHYRVTLDGPAARYLPDLAGDRASPLAPAILPALAPWRRTGRHVLLALPGETFGRAWGLDMRPWIAGAEAAVRAATDRPVIVRAKGSDRDLAADLADAWAVVTHSSNVAVDAVLAGIPAVCEATSPTAPLGNLGLQWLAAPECHDRGPWLASLLAQQWTLAEMHSGEAWRTLARLIPGAGAASVIQPDGVT